MKDNKGIIIFLIIILFIGLSVYLSSRENKEEEVELMSGIHNVVISVEDYGDIYVELDADTAPITVTNFINLANSGFYDGLTFHRIIDGFMIQGGDPAGDGTGGSSETIKGEFSLNGVENNISHERGVISMARASDYDSASSQFFIVQEDSTHLDSRYAAFGHVTEGMDIVDKIASDAEPIDDNGTIASDEQPVITTIKSVGLKGTIVPFLSLICKYAIIGLWSL